MRSIQQRMLIITLTLFVCAWVGTVVSTYFSLKHKSQVSHDADLKNYALIIAGFSHRLIVNSGEETTLKRIEDELAAEYDIPLAFNVVHQETIVARSAGAPNFPLSETVNVRSVEMEESGQPVQWRVYYHYDNSDDMWVIVAETRAAFNTLLYSVIFQAIWPNMVFLPLMLLAIYISVRQSLKPLHELAGHVETQTAEYLKPIDIGDVPSEVEPLVKSLNKMLERLTLAFENEHAFTANAAHELRTPLSALKTEAQILRQLDIHGPAASAVRRIEVRVDRATHLVSQLLTLARMESGEVFENPEEVDLDEVVSGVIGEISDSAGEKGINILYSADENCTVRGMPVALGILARNLIDNAIRYTQPGTSVTVTLQNAPGQVVFSVVDVGPGIPEDKFEDILKKFYRLPGSSESGSGLGLSIVDRIVQLHSANMHIKMNDSGEGLNVTVVFS